MATVNKNFRIKQGLIVEGATGTINGQDILTKTGGDSYILNLVGGATLVTSVESTQMEVISGELNIKSGVFDAYGAAAAAQSAATTAAASDATTKANAAQSAAITAAATDATTKVAAEAALRVSGDAASVSTAAADATSKANAAQAAAEATAAADATTKANAAQAAAISTAAADATSKANAAQAAAISAAATAAGTAIATAVDGLVDGAPALLNTLNELAAAINDDANYSTTLTTALNGKAPLASPALTGVPTAPTAAADTNSTQIATTAFAKGEADAAQAAAEATAAADATTKANAAQSAATTAAATDATNKANAAQAAAEATASAANTAQQNGTTSFTAINYNSVAKQVAATTGNIVTAAATTAISWVAADYRSAKFVVKVKNGVHTQVSDLVVTLDTANNVAVSEYGITYSNGTELAAVTADYSGSDVRIRVTPANANTEVIVVGTLIK